MYVECRENFSATKRWVSVCFCWSVHGSVGVFGSVFAFLACAFMLFSVTFNVAMRDV